MQKKLSQLEIKTSTSVNLYSITLLDKVNGAVVIIRIVIILRYWLWCYQRQYGPLRLATFPILK